MANPVKSITQAKLSAHIVLAVFAGSQAMWVYLRQQEIFNAWVAVHPWVPILVGAVQAGCFAGALYWKANKDGSTEGPKA